MLAQHVAGQDSQPHAGGHQVADRLVAAQGQLDVERQPAARQVPVDGPAGAGAGLAEQEGVGDEIRQLEAKLEDARARQKAMAIRSEAASSRLNVQSQVARGDSQAVVSKFERMERRIDEMEARGIVGPMEGSKPRQVLITRQQWYEMNMRNTQ